MDRWLPRSCHCSQGTSMQSHSPSRRGFEEQGFSSTHEKTCKKPGCFSSQRRPSSTRTRKTRPGWWQRLSRLSTGRRDEIKAANAHTPSKHKSHTSLFPKCCEQATVSLMPKKGTPTGLHSSIRPRGFGVRTGISGESPTISSSKGW